MSKPSERVPRYRVHGKVLFESNAKDSGVRFCVWDSHGRLPRAADYKYRSIINATRKAREANASIGL